MLADVNIELETLLCLMLWLHHVELNVIISFPLINRIHINVQVVIITRKMLYPTWHSLIQKYLNQTNIWMLYSRKPLLWNPQWVLLILSLELSDDTSVICNFSKSLAHLEYELSQQGNFLYLLHSYKISWTKCFYSILCYSVVFSDLRP